MFGTLTLRGSVFYDNNAPGIGATVYAAGSLPNEIAGNTIAFNHGGSGGLEFHGDFNVHHNIVSNNDAPGGVSPFLGPPVMTGFPA